MTQMRVLRADEPLDEAEIAEIRRATKLRGLLLDVLFLLGFGLLGAGVYLWFGLAPALVVSGVTLMGIGIYGASRQTVQPTP